MSAINELIVVTEDGKLSFGNHLLTEKAKKEDFEFDGDMYKVKTYNAMTKLEKNGLFLYESVPGTSVNDFALAETGMTFKVEGTEDAQLTIGLKDDAEYKVYVDGVAVGHMKTNMGGKLVISLELAGSTQQEVKVVQA